MREGNVYIVSKRTGTVFDTGLVDASAGPFTDAAQLTLRVNRNDGSVSILNKNTVTSISIDGYEIISDNALLNEAGWASLASVPTPGWEEAANNSDTGLAEFDPNAGASLEITPGSTVSLGLAYKTDVSAAMAAVGFGNPYEDVMFNYSNTNTNALVSDVVVEYVGQERQNNLVLEVNINSGQATIINESALPVDIDFYQLTSDDGALDVNFDGLTQSGSPVAGWLTGGSNSANGLVQFYPTPAEGFTVAAGEEFNLGSTYTALGQMQDVDFLFSIIGGDISGFSGFVRFVSTLSGDFNDDGVVDEADYTVWLSSLGNPDESAINNAGDGIDSVDDGDYLVWKNNFGATSGSGVGTARSSVPEPLTIVLSLLTIGLLSIWQRALLVRE